MALPNCINSRISKTYASWNCSYALAIEFQQQVIDAWESHGARAEDELREALRLLEQLKKKASSASADAYSSTKALPTPPESRSSEPNISLHQSTRV